MLLAGALCFFIPTTDQGKDVMSFALGVGPITVRFAFADMRILVYAKRLQVPTRLPNKLDTRDGLQPGGSED